MNEMKILLLLYERVEIAKWIVSNCKYKHKAVVARPLLEQKKSVLTRMPNTIVTFNDNVLLFII